MKLMQRPNAYCVVGHPGCGKTYSIAQSIKNNIPTYGETGIIVCSLTKTAAKEASGRVNLPPGGVGTLHSFAYRAIGGGNVAESHLDDWNDAMPSLKINEEVVVADIDDQTMDTRCVGGDGDELSSKYNLLRARCVPKEAWPSDVRMFAKKWEEWKQSSGLIDFSDMIEIATTDTMTAPGNPYLIYADEVQDCSVAEARLMSHWGSMARKIVCVGDPLQSLYEWRGASPDEFFPPDIDKDHKHCLSQSYRVPEAVRDAAVRWISTMPGYIPEPYHARKLEDGTTAKGSVTFSDDSINNAHAIVELCEKAIKTGTVMVLASCAYMLKPIVAALRSAGLSFWNPYRRKNGAWNPLYSKGITGRDRVLSYIAPSPDYWEPKETRPWTIQDIQAWSQVLAADGVIRYGMKQEILHADPELTWPEIGSKLDEWFTEDAMAKLANMDIKYWEQHITASKKKIVEFPLQILRRQGAKALKEKPRIIVGSVHSVKGGEAETVIVAPDLSRAGYEEFESGSKGVHRLYYVAMTRSRENLILLNRSNQMAVEWV